MTVKILLDTDIGSDIDDAVALAYLLMQPEAELLGMTTVSGQSRLRAATAEVWFQKEDMAFFHDPLAAVSLFDPERFFASYFRVFG